MSQPQNSAPADFLDDNPEWTVEDFAKARPAHEVLPAEILSQFTNTRQRGPQKAPKKVATSIRLSPEVIAYFKRSGPGWQARIDAALKAIAEKEERRARKLRKQDAA